jgi:hypothetical protein
MQHRVCSGSCLICCSVCILQPYWDLCCAPCFCMYPSWLSLGRLYHPTAAAAANDSAWSCVANLLRLPLLLKQPSACNSRLYTSRARMCTTACQPPLPSLCTCVPHQQGCWDLFQAVLMHCSPFLLLGAGPEFFEDACRKFEHRLDELHDMLAPYSRAMQPVKVGTHV